MLFALDSLFLYIRHYLYIHMCVCMYFINVSDGTCLHFVKHVLAGSETIRRLDIWGIIKWTRTAGIDNEGSMGEHFYICMCVCLSVCLCNECMLVKVQLHSYISACYVSISNLVCTQLNIHMYMYNIYVRMYIYIFEHTLWNHNMSSCSLLLSLYRIFRAHFQFNFTAQLALAVITKNS